MNINNFIYILVLIFSFQYDISAEKYLEFYERDLENELIDMVQRHQENSDQTVVDPNDRVHVKLWNKLNDEDIKNMPQIDDYSNEDTALRWLKWHTRVSLRYQQVVN
jgi:hypothetical protein